MVDLCRPYLAFNETFLDRFAALHHITAKKLRTRALDWNPSIKIDTKLPAWADPNVGNIVDSFNAMPFYGSRIRSPGEYSLDNELVKVGTPQWIKKWEEYVTNEYIHPSLRIRLGETVKLWKPEGHQVPWSSPIQELAMRHFVFGKQSDLGNELSDPGKLERGLTRPGSGYVWTKSSAVDNARLIISEWDVASSLYQKLNPDVESFEQRLLMEVEHENNTIECNQYEEVWNELKKPSKLLGLPLAQDWPIFDRLLAGYTIVWGTTYLILSTVFKLVTKLVTAGPLFIWRKIAGPKKPNQKR